jgi:hypothetical protein
VAPQGLYCCLKETAYTPIATVPCFLVTFTSMACVVYFYFQVRGAVNEWHPWAGEVGGHRWVFVVASLLALNHE